jgi:multidrug efflux system membrane fusion protein
MLIDSGLSAGEMVVVDGQEKLRDGSKVTPSNQQHPNAAASAAGAGAAGKGQGNGQKPAGAAQHP